MNKMKKCMDIALAMVFLTSGFLFAFVAGSVNHMRFGLYLWPLIVSVDAFAVSTWGFFLTEEKCEIVYGFCSIATAVCTIVQLALLF